MEFRVFPRGFNIVPLKMNQPDGSTVDAVQVTILDITSQPVHITFAEADWKMFQRAVADPVGEAEREAVRARIVRRSARSLQPGS